MISSASFFLALRYLRPKRSLVSIITLISVLGVMLGVGVLVVAGSVAINLLELFVAFLQAFIFTFLTTLFIGMSVVFHHDDHGGEQGHHEAAAH